MQAATWRIARGGFGSVGHNFLNLQKHKRVCKNASNEAAMCAHVHVGEK